MDKIKIRGYIGIALLIIMFVCFFGWETYGRNALMYTNVIALKQHTIKGEIITEENIKVLNIEKDSVKSGISDPKKIIGEVALVDIPPDIPVSKTYFDDTKNTPVGDQFIFEIPNEWIYGVPQSIRAKDTAYFYEVKEGQKINGTMVVENTPDKKTKDAEENESEVLEVENDTKKIEKNKNIEYLFSASIKYVKDSGNREVVNVEKGNRNDGSSKVYSLEIIGTQDDLDMLESKAKNGSKFIIMYKE